ncbi:hypothetical protein ACJX0J_024315, partial [Zea mays]
ICHKLVIKLEAQNWIQNCRWQENTPVDFQEKLHPPIWWLLGIVCCLSVALFRFRELLETRFY